MDDRNYDITNRINEILNQIKGFDNIALSNPRVGKLIIRYRGEDFILSIDPVYEDSKDVPKEFGKTIEDYKFIWRD